MYDILIPNIFMKLSTHIPINSLLQKWIIILDLMMLRKTSCLNTISNDTFMYLKLYLHNNTYKIS